MVRIDRPSGPVVIQVFQDGQATEPLTLAAPGMVWPVADERMNVQLNYRGQADGAYRFNSIRISERVPN